MDDTQFTYLSWVLGVVFFGLFLYFLRRDKQRAKMRK